MRVFITDAAPLRQGYSGFLTERIKRRNVRDTTRQMEARLTALVLLRNWYNALVLLRQPSSKD